MKFLLIFACFAACVTTAYLAPTEIATLSPPPPPISKDDNRNIESFVKSLDRKPNLLLAQTLKTDKKGFIGLILIPYIICFFAAKGFWPMYPPMMQYQVSEMGKKVFALNDDRIRQFCRGKFSFQEMAPCYRPGYFVPVTDPTDCITVAPVGGGATTASPAAAAAQWNAPARIQSNKNSVKASAQPQKNPIDIEVFSAGGGAETITKPPTQNTVENLDEKQPQNINIEIHNVFTFGAENPKNLNLEKSVKNVTHEV